MNIKRREFLKILSATPALYMASKHGLPNGDDYRLQPEMSTGIVFFDGEHTWILDYTNTCLYKYDAYGVFTGVIETNIS